MEFALPDLAGVVAAGLLLLLACALILLGYLIANTFGRLPVVGSWVTSNITQSLTDAANAVLAAADATWHFAAGLFNWLSDVFLKPYIYAVQFAIKAWGWLQHLANVTIPDAEARAVSYAANVAAEVEGDARTLFTAAEQYAGTVAAQAETRADALFTDAEQYAAGLVSRADQALSDAILNAEVAAASEISTVAGQLAAGTRAVAAAATSDLDSLAAQASGAISDLARDTSLAVAGAEALAAANLAAVRSGIYTDLDTWGNEAVSTAWPGSAGDIDALRGTLGADFPWLQDLLPALAGAGAAGLLGALIRSLAGAQAVTNLANDCTVPLCRNLSGLGNDLANLAGLIESGLLFAWLAYGVADPAGWAADVNSFLGPLGNSTVSTAQGVFGGS